MGKIKKPLIQISWVVIAIVVFSALVLKFVKLEEAPGGFFVDENDIAINAVCLAQAGHDAQGAPWPGFISAGGGGILTPVHLYALAGWMKIFGISIRAQRAMNAFTTVLTLFGIYFLGCLLFSRMAAIFAVFAGVLSPWAFLFGRQAMDDPCMAPLGLVWGTYFFLKSNRVRDGILAALFYSLAFYAYVPFRAAIPVFGISLFIYKRWRYGVHWRQFTTFLITGIIVCLPLIYSYFFGELLVRFNMVGIFSPQYRQDIGAVGLGGIIRVFLKNMALHFSPQFLFKTGDRNLRHSSQFTGELGWLDDLALAAGVIYFACAFFRKLQSRSPVRELFDKSFLLILAGFVAGIVPAALTWESIPHALRAIAAWPFVSLAAGYIFWKVSEHFELMIPAAALVSAVFSWSLHSHLFKVYPNISGAWFDTNIKDFALQAQATGNWENYLDQAKQYGTGPGTRRYYLIRYGPFDCDSSDVFVKLYQQNHPAP